MTTVVRDGAPEDAASLAALYQRSVRELGARDYTAAQVEAWAGAGPTADRLAALMADGRRRFVAVGGSGEILGFADLEPDGHLHFLYVAPSARGTGAAGALMDAVEAQARAWGVSLSSEASAAARRFLLRRGFSVIERRDFEVGGVPIHNYAVEKAL